MVFEPLAPLSRGTRCGPHCCGHSVMLWAHAQLGEVARRMCTSAAAVGNAATMELELAAKIARVLVANIWG